MTRRAQCSDGASVFRARRSTAVAAVLAVTLVMALATGCGSTDETGKAPVHSDDPPRLSGSDQERVFKSDSRVEQYCIDQIPPRKKRAVRPRSATDRLIRIAQRHPYLIYDFLSIDGTPPSTMKGLLRDTATLLDDGLTGQPCWPQEARRIDRVVASLPSR